MPTATAVAPAAMKSAAWRPLAIPPIPITGISTAAATAADLLERDRADRGARDPAGAPPSHGSPRLRVERHALERVDERDGVGAALLGGGGHRGGVRGVRRQLHDQRLRAERAHALDRRAVSAGSAPITRPVSTFGQDTFSSSIATSSRSPTAATSGASSSRLKPITETTSGTGSSASSGRSGARKPSSPLLGSPIELISPAGVSQSRGGGLPWRGSSGDRLRDEGVEGEPLEQGVAEGAPGRDRVEGAGAVQDRAAQRDAAELDARGRAGGRRSMPAPADQRRLEAAASTTGPSTQSRR